MEFVVNVLSAHHTIIQHKVVLLFVLESMKFIVQVHAFVPKTTIELTVFVANVHQTPCIIHLLKIVFAMELIKYLMEHLVFVYKIIISLMVLAVNVLLELLIIQILKYA